jgi:hypothetical protein
MEKVMDEEGLLYFNGACCDGGYFTPPILAEDLMARILEAGIDPPSNWVVEQIHEPPKGDPRRRPIEDIQRKWDLAETGWAVVFAPGIDRRVKKALQDLLDFREAQATRGGDRFQVIDDCRPGESVLALLQRKEVGWAAVGDSDYFPYHVLLVGEPEDLPYEFQFDFDISFAVGRLCFERWQDYREYAHSVIQAETRRPARPRRLGFFAPAHPGDPVTEGAASGLVRPLADTAAQAGPGWEVSCATGEEATKDWLRASLGGATTPALLFAACHGLACREGDSRQGRLQGALVCQDWAGPKSGLGPGATEYFSAADIGKDASLEGLIAFFLACYGAGTPERDSFDPHAYLRPKRIAPRSFVAELPRKLLSHPGGGALAVVGHVDRAWDTLFQGSERGEGRHAFVQAIQRLLEGHTIGYAIERFNKIHATMSGALWTLHEKWRSNEKVDARHFCDVWRFRKDVRNFIVLGDPAVRLPGVGELR